MMVPGDESTDESGLFAEINVTPFVDVMLVLLVMFMVAAPLLVKGVPLELPRTAGRALGKPTAPVVLSLTRDGTLFLGDQRLRMEELDGRLSSLRANQADPMIYLRADRGVPYGDVADIIGRLSAGGFSHVSLLSRAETSR